MGETKIKLWNLIRFREKLPSPGGHNSNEYKINNIITNKRIKSSIGGQTVKFSKKTSIMRDPAQFKQNQWAVVATSL